MVDGTKKSEPHTKVTDPYCSFKNDKYRFRALVVREVCNVGRWAGLVAIVYIYGPAINLPAWAAFFSKSGP